MGLLIRLLCCWLILALATHVGVVEASLAGVENAPDLVVVASGGSDKGTVGGSIRSGNWDNRLTNGPGVSSIVYDVDGSRIKKVAGSTTTWYLVATVNPTGYPQVVEKFTGSTPGTNTLSRVYGYGLDLLHQRQMPGNTPNFYGYDGQGSVRFLANSSGAITDTYVYDSYGNLITGSSSIVNNNAYRYTGEQWDADLGMYYLRARYYQPSVGRFWTRDTYEGDQSDPLSLHRYLYTQGNPVNRIDPSGHFTEGINGVLTTIGIQTTLFAIRYGPTIARARVAFGLLTLALATADREFAAVYVSSGGNAGAEAAYLYGEVRTLRAALIAARSVPSAIAGFTQAETAIINEARQIFRSAEFAQLRAAKAAGTTLRLTINGRTIQYEAGAPFSGFTWAEKSGFVLGEEAFTSEAELAKTVLHELHRLHTSVILQSGTVTEGLGPTTETLNAFQFAEKAGRNGL